MKNVETICAHMSAAYYRTFEIYVYASQHMFRTMYSHQNNSKGWTTSGLVCSDKKPGPDVLLIRLGQCSSFVQLCPTAEQRNAAAKKCEEMGRKLAI